MNVFFNVFFELIPLIVSIIEDLWMCTFVLTVSKIGICSDELSKHDSDLKYSFESRLVTDKCSRRNDSTLLLSLGQYVGSEIDLVSRLLSTTLNFNCLPLMVVNLEPQ